MFSSTLYNKDNLNILLKFGYHNDYRFITAAFFNFLIKKDLTVDFINFVFVPEKMLL
jgi:hypothetical protein